MASLTVPTTADVIPGGGGALDLDAVLLVTVSGVRLSTDPGFV